MERALAVVTYFLPITPQFSLLLPVAALYSLLPDNNVKLVQANAT